MNMKKIITLIILSMFSVFVLTNIGYYFEDGFIVNFEHFDISSFLILSVTLSVISFVIWHFSKSKSWARILLTTILLPLSLWFFGHLFSGSFSVSEDAGMLLLMIYLILSVIVIIISFIKKEIIWLKRLRNILLIINMGGLIIFLLMSTIRW